MNTAFLANINKNSAQLNDNVSRFIDDTYNKRWYNAGLPPPTPYYVR